jgi:hypothetical protein
VVVPAAPELALKAKARKVEGEVKIAKRPGKGRMA